MWSTRCIKRADAIDIIRPSEPTVKPQPVLEMNLGHPCGTVQVPRSKRRWQGSLVQTSTGDAAALAF